MRTFTYRASKIWNDLPNELPGIKSLLKFEKARLTNDTLYDVPLTSLEGLPPPPNNIKQFSKTALKFHDFVKVLNSRRNASATGLNAIPYKVYKKCPQIYLSFPHIYFLYPQFCHPFPMAICKGNIYP